MSDKVSYCLAKPSQIRFSARYADAHTRAYSSLNSTIAHSPLRTHPREGSVDQQIKSLRQPSPSDGDKMPVTRSSRYQQGSVDQVKRSKGEGVWVYR
jgi:hypothetical protein